MFVPLLISALAAGTLAAPSTFIVNGTNATMHDFPYMVSLQYNLSHTCGASIINENYVMTSATCVDRRNDPKSFRIFYGHVHLNCMMPTFANVSKIIIHENFTFDMPFTNDIALLKLSTPLEYGPKVQPVKLPKQGEATPESSNATLVGWGLPYSGADEPMNQLQMVFIDIFKNIECSKLHEELFSEDVQLCAGVSEGGKGQCTGDAGGPLTVNGTQYGIASWSIKPCATKGKPGVFTRVANYVNWIAANAK